MPAYRLICTRRNHDGSFDTPSIDLSIEAADDRAAIDAARRFPRLAYGEADLAWLVDRSRRVLWSSNGRLAEAA